MSTLHRRAVLKGMLSLSAGALGASLCTSAGAAPTPGPTPAPTPFVRDTPPTPTPIPAGTGYVTPRSPYSVSSSVSLSEDCFTTNQILFNDPAVHPFAAADEVQAFTFQGITGALVLAGEQVACLWPDAASPSGWQYQQLTTVGKVLSMAVGTVSATASNGAAQDEVYALFLVKDPSGARYCVPWAMLTEPGVWGALDAVPAPQQLVERPLQCAYDQDQLLTFYSVGALGAIDWYVPSPSAFQHTNVGGFPSNSAALLVATDQSTLQYFGFYLAASINSSTYELTRFNSVDASTSTIGEVGSGAGLLSADWLGRTNGGADTLIVTYEDQDGTFQIWTDAGPIDFTSTLPTSISQLVSRKTGDGSYVLFAVCAGQIHLIRVYEDDDGNLYSTPNIPLQDQVSSITISETGDYSSLFFVDAAYALNYLRRNLTTGAWQTFPMHQAGEVHVAMQAWRVELTILDANGKPVPGFDFTLGALGPIDIWQDGGGQLLDAGATTTFTTNGLGRVTFAIPASELSTSGVTVEGDGLPLTSVLPDGEVHTYLTGSTQPLNGLQPLTGSSLSGAEIYSDSAPPATSAEAAAGAISQGITAGLNAAQGQAPGSSDTQSFHVTMGGGQVQYQAYTSVLSLAELHQRAGTKNVELGSFWDDVKDDAESVYHGIRSGATLLATAAGQFYADTKQWEMQLVDSLGRAINLIVKDARSAVHFVSSVFHAIGADIEKALKWLGAEVLALLTHTGTAAETLLGWMHKIPDFVTDNILTDVQANADSFAASLKSDIAGWLQPLKDQFKDQDLTSMATIPVGVSQVAGPLTSPASGNSAHRNWLLHKLENVVSDLDLTLPAFNDSVSSTFSTLLESFEKADVDLFDAAIDVWNALVTAVEDPADFKTLGMASLIDALALLLDGIVDFFTAVVDALLDVTVAVVQSITDVLDYELTNVPLLGDLLRLAGITDLSLGRLACLATMFPAVLAYQIDNGKDYELFNYGDPDKGTKSVELTQASGLSYGVSGALLIWSIVTGIDDSDGSDGEPEKNPYLNLLVLFDNLCFVATLVLGYPGDPKHAAEPFTALMPNDGSADDALAISVYGFAFVEFALNFLKVGIDNNRGTTNIELSQAMIRVALSAVGLFEAVGGAVSAVQTNQNAGAVASQILSEIPATLTMLIDPRVKDATEDASGIAKLLVDLLCLLSAAGAQMESNW